MAEKMQSIRLVVGTFDGESFKRIKHAKIGGVSYRDKLTAVWFELLDLAGKSNANGYLIDNNGNPYQSYDDIASMIDRDVKELELCMGFYLAEKMVEIVEETYMVANFTKYQIPDGLEKIRSQNRERQAKLREKRRNVGLPCGVSEKVMNKTGNATDGVMNSDSNVTRNVTSRDMCITSMRCNANGVTRNVTSRDSNVTNNVMCITPKKKKKVTKKEKELVLNNNINTIHACARKGILTAEQLEREMGCVGWENYPCGDDYAAIRNVLLELINDNTVSLQEMISLNEIDIDLISEIQNSMYKGRERRHITDLRAYILSIINRKRKERRGE